MLSLCEPYGHTITCLCDQDTSVLRCFLTEEEGGREEDLVVEEESSVRCTKHVNMKTEMIIAGAILVMVIGLLCM